MLQQDGLSPDGFQIVLDDLYGERVPSNLDEVLERIEAHLVDPRDRQRGLRRLRQAIAQRNSKPAFPAV